MGWSGTTLSCAAAEQCTLERRSSDCWSATPLPLPAMSLHCRLLSSAGATLVAFFIGAVGTLLGTAVAYWLVGPRLGPDGWKVAAALCASYIGG